MSGQRRSGRPEDRAAALVEHPIPIRPTTVNALCATCSAPLEPPVHPRRKFCSDHCRKAQYGGTCIDCGAPTDGSNGRDKAPERCRTCIEPARIAKVTETTQGRARPRRERIAEMWASGMTLSQIAVELGLAKGAVAAIVHTMREQGWDLPHRRTPEQCARIRAGRWGA